MRFWGKARYRAGIAVAVVTASVFGAAAFHNVPTALTVEDREAARLMLARAGYDDAWTARLDLTKFDHQIDAVIAEQDAVLQATPRNVAIQMNVSREPADVLRYGKGICYDRSRAMAKLLQVLGLPVRHLSVYSTAVTGSKLVSLLTPQVASHAVTEVKTSRGWMLIESNTRWIALSDDGHPVSAREIYRQTYDQHTNDTQWTTRNVDKINEIFAEQFTYIIGLYSRHGRFYPPFNSVPDVNWTDFVFGNLSEI